MKPRLEEPGNRVERIVRDARQVLNALIKEADRAIHRDTDLGNTGCPIAAGCSIELNPPDFRQRCTSPATTSSASFSTYIRACACMP